MNIYRSIMPHVHAALFHGKIVVIYGPRQVGKTTLSREIMATYENTRYLTGDDPATRMRLTDPSLQQLRELFSGRRLVVIDEAQRITNIGITLKLLADHIPEVQIIATGSSSFDLANTINEPLTGRTTTFYLYPFSREEISSSSDPISRPDILKNILITGMYPEVFLHHQTRYLIDIVDSYLYKDILEHQKIKKSDMLMKLLQAIALQI